MTALSATISPPMGTVVTMRSAVCIAAPFISRRDRMRGFPRRGNRVFRRATSSCAVAMPLGQTTRTSNCRDGRSRIYAARSNKTSACWSAGGNLTPVEAAIMSVNSWATVCSKWYRSGIVSLRKKLVSKCRIAV